ncbi:MAG TPA: hypothetical protein VFO46_05530, partial [Candidatus Sulfotelmatobacter sp.]|nr:hypothetical protein [Candidatus Sulfotelmatobacter sp.]
RKWCRPETHFSQTPHRTRLFAAFIVGNQYRATPEPLSPRCENPALPAPGKEFKHLFGKTECCAVLLFASPRPRRPLLGDLCGKKQRGKISQNGLSLLSS